MMFAKFRNLKLRWKLLIGVQLYFVLVPVEGLVIGHIDRKTRADRSIFVAYVDRLPKPLWIPGPSYQGWCEHPRVWGFWRYKICTTMVTYTKSGASFGTEFPCPPPLFQSAVHSAKSHFPSRLREMEENAVFVATGQNCMQRKRSY